MLNFAENLGRDISEMIRFALLIGMTILGAIIPFILIAGGMMIVSSVLVTGISLLFGIIGFILPFLPCILICLLLYYLGHFMGLF